MQNFENNFFPELSNDISDNLVIPDSANSATHPTDKKSESVHYFAIDSRQRDYYLYPDANNYNIGIPDSYNNVTSVELKAAMLPRSEYNVNSCNKYIDYVIGSHIISIKIKKGHDKEVITKNNKKIDPGTYNLTISKPNLPNVKNTPAEISVDIDNDGFIKSFVIKNSGNGYSYSKKPYISLFDFQFFDVEIGYHYSANMREGQYSIGGNPNMYIDNKNKYQSWVPSKLLNEIESAMSNEILNDSKYCYGRKSLSSYSSYSINNYATDYPLLFNVRIMNQYPNISVYENSVQDSPEDFETNSCKFNRLYVSNSLIFILTINDISLLPQMHSLYYIIDNKGIQYNILKYTLINENEIDKRYVIYCSLDINFREKWFGYEHDNSNNYDVELCHFEMLFATGENKVINSATLLGFNKQNYYNNSQIDTIKFENHFCLIPKSLTFSSVNDYYLFGDPEYIVLSFRPKYGANNIKGVNNRVDSMENSNINRVFACLIFDPIQPAVLQDLSSGTELTTVNSLSNSAEKNKIVENSDIVNNMLLNGNVGNFNSSDYRQPGMVRAMKGYDFDQKIIKFPQPLSSLSHLNIRFTKFSKEEIGSEKELYNFHGKEHFLLFEVKCSDTKTGDRF